MLVSQLIELLKKFPAHKEVYIDVSPSQADYWAFAQANDADEAQIDEGDTVVLISPQKLSELSEEKDNTRYN